MVVIIWRSFKYLSVIIHVFDRSSAGWKGQLAGDSFPVSSSERAKGWASGC